MTVSTTVRIEDLPVVYEMYQKYHGRIVGKQGPPSNIKLRSNRPDLEIRELLRDPNTWKRFKEFGRKPESTLIRFPDLELEEIFVEEFKSFFDADQIRRIDRKTF